MKGKAGLETDRKIIYKKCDEGIAWVMKYKQNNLQEDDFKKKEEEFKAFFDPIVTKFGLVLDDVHKPKGCHGHR